MDHPPDGAGTLRAPSGWMLDRDGHRIVGASGVAQPLTNLEFLLLSMLESRSGAAVPIVELGDSLWGEGQWSRDMLYNAVKRTRRKLDACDPDAGQSIVSVARTGYRFDRDATAAKQPAVPALLGRSRWPGERRWWLLAGSGAAAVLATVALAMSALPKDPLGLGGDHSTPSPAVPADTMKGRAVNAAGQPLSNVNVVACNGRTSDLCPRTTTGSDGTFEFAIEPGIWQVSLRRDGQALATYVLATGTFHEIVARDAPAIPGRLATTTPSGAGRLAGRLNDAVAGVQVTACNADTPNPCPFGYVGADGSFELRVPDGNYVVSFSLPGQSRPALSVAMNTGETQEFRLPK